MIIESPAAYGDAIKIAEISTLPTTTPAATTALIYAGSSNGHFVGINVNNGAFAGVGEMTSLANFGGVWLGTTAMGAKTNTNFALAADGSSYCILNCGSTGGNINFNFAGNSYVQLSTTEIFPSAPGGVAIGGTANAFGNAYVGGGNGGYFQFIQAATSSHDAQAGVVTPGQLYFFKTTDTAAHAAFTISTVSGDFYTVEVSWSARETGAAAHGGGGRICGVFYNNTGTVTQVGSTTVVYNNVTGAGSPDLAQPTFSVSTSTIVFNVQSNVATAVDWQMVASVNNC